MNLFVGIDVGKKNLEFCGVDAVQNKVFGGSTTNDLPGADNIKAAILKWLKKKNTESDDSDDLRNTGRLVIGMESTSIYHVHAMEYFTSAKELNRLGAIVVNLNPTTTSRFSKLFDAGKNDKVDAYHIALLLTNSQLYQQETNLAEAFLALQRLTRERFHLVQMRTDFENHFLNNLFYKLSAAEKQIKGSIFSATMMTLLSGEKYSLSQLGKMSIAELTAVIDQLGRGRFENAETVAKELKAAIRISYDLGHQVATSIDFVLGQCAAQIRMLNMQIKQYDTIIKQTCEKLPEAQCLRSIPGIGPVYSAGIIAEIGQISRFKNQDKLAKYAGLAWQESQSGNSKKDDTPLVKTGNHYLRYYLVEAADSVSKQDPVFAKYFKKKEQEALEHQQHRADVLTARKLVRLVFRLLKDRRLYQAAYNGLGETAQN